MSLGQALSTAISGLTTSQQRIAIASSNIANVNTPGYSRKIVAQEAVLLGGTGAGAQVADVTRNVDRNLQAQLRNETGDLGREQVLAEYFERMQDLFGTPQSDASLVARLSDLADAFDQLAIDPEQNAPLSQVLDRAAELVDNLDRMSEEIQNLRQAADDQIARNVEIINTDLNRIADLNSQIVRLKNLGQPSTELEDQRDIALESLSRYVNVNTFVRSEGDVVVLSGNGSRQLLDRSVFPLSFTPSSSFVAGSSATGITLGSTDITSEFSSGEINGLIALRDRLLPEFQDQINEMTLVIRDEINALHNNGTAFPPPENITGTRAVAATDLLTGVGTFRVAELDSSGNVLAYKDIDLSDMSTATNAAVAAPTVNDLITVINSIGNLTASIDQNGSLRIEGSNGSRVGINEINSSVALLDSSRMSSNAQPGGYTVSAAGNLDISLGAGRTTVAYAAGQSLATIAGNINAALGAGTATVSGGALLLQNTAGGPIYVSDDGPLGGEIGLDYAGDTRGLSHYFGLNDFFATTNSTAQLYSDPQTAQDQAIGATAGNLTITIQGLASFTTAYTNTTTLQQLETAIEAAATAGPLTAAQAQSFVEVIPDGNRFRLVFDTGVLAGAPNIVNFADSGSMTQTLGIREDRPQVARDVSVSKVLLDDPSRVARAELNADTYESVAGQAAATQAIVNANPAIGAITAGPGNLIVRGAWGNVFLPYTNTTTLQQVADAVNNNATLTNQNIRATVEFKSSSGGFVLRIDDQDGDAFVLEDSEATVVGVTTLIEALEIDTLPFGVNAGDNAAAKNIATKFDASDIDFDPAGGLSGERTSLGDYAAAILSASATNAANARSNADFQDVLRTDLDTKVKNLAAVNLDEELSELVLLQNAYAASARVISTVDELFDTLFGAI